MTTFTWDPTGRKYYTLPADSAKGFMNPLTDVLTGNITCGVPCRRISRFRWRPPAVGNDTRYRIYPIYFGWPNPKGLERSAARSCRFSPLMRTGAGQMECVRSWVDFRCGW